jgi:hypothetical protein
MAFPNYTNIFSGGGTQTPQTPLAGSLSSLFSDYAKFKEASGGGFKEEDFLPFAIFMQQRNADRMNDPANITGNLVTKAADTLTASLGAKFAYDQPVFNAIGGAYNPNPYAYGVLNRRGGVA